MPSCRRSWRRLGPAAALLAALALASGCDGADEEALDPSLIHSVARGDLTITVRERGEVRAERDTRVTSELEGRATLIYLIPEGTVVEAGEKLAELDVSGIVEKRAQQAIVVARAESALEQARKRVEIVEKELRAAERTAETRLEIARLRHQKFLGQEHGAAALAGDGARPTGTNSEMVGRLRELLEGGETAASAPGSSGAHLVGRVMRILGPESNLELEMGEMANLILQQIDSCSLARADLELADETLFHSRKLAAKGFITANELERDEINYERERSKQTVAWNDLLLLVNYTLPETLLGLELEVENADLQLESVRAANEARRVAERAELDSTEAEFTLAKEQLANWERQIQNGVLRAPSAGLVVYGRFDWDEPVYEGMEVRERQEVVILPDISSMVADIQVPESQIGKLAPGQRATLTVDAFPSRVFGGVVTEVSSLPEPSRRSQVVTLYEAVVRIDGRNADGALRPGMNATVTVAVGTLRDVVNVPMLALERSGDRHYVWELGPDGFAPAPVELGGNDLTHVEVVSGLAEGDRIALVRPPGARVPDSGEDGRGAEPDAEPSEPELEHDVLSAGDRDGPRGEDGSGSQ